MVEGCIDRRRLDPAQPMPSLVGLRLLVGIGLWCCLSFAEPGVIHRVVNVCNVRTRTDVMEICS